MRKFLITSPNYSGQVETVFDPDEHLVFVSFMNATLTASQKTRLLHAVPMEVNLLPELVKTYPQLTVVEGDYHINFDAFWSRYGRKINRMRAMAVWNKLPSSDQVKAYYGINAYEKYLRRESWRSKADPENYLKNKYWENEY